MAMRARNNIMGASEGDTIARNQLDKITATLDECFEAAELLQDVAVLSKPPQPDVSELLEALKDASAELNRRNRYDVQYETTRVLANVGFVIKRAEQKGAE